MKSASTSTTVPRLITQGSPLHPLSLNSFTLPTPEINRLD